MTAGRPPKPEGQVATSHLHIRVKPRDKAAWVKAAQRRGMTLSEWVVDTLNWQA